MSKLGIDERESLGELLEHPAIQVLLQLLNDTAVGMEHAIVSFNVTASQDSERELFIRKARAEGARQLISAFNQKVEKLRPKAN